MNIGKLSFDQIVKTTFDQTKIKFATAGIFITLVVSMLFSYVQSYLIYQGTNPFLYSATGVVSAIATGLLMVYVLLGTAAYIKMDLSKTKSKIDASSVLPLFSKAILVSLLLVLIFLAVLVAGWALGFLVRIPVVGPYLMAILSVPAVVFFALFAVYASVTAKMALIAVVDDPKKSVVDIVESLVVMAKDKGKKVFFNAILSLLPVLTLAVAGLLLLAIGYVIYIGLGWYMPGFAAVLSLSVQGGMNFLAFLINLSGSALLAYYFAHILVMVMTAMYSIYLDAK